jgi:hypothetical protein
MEEARKAAQGGVDRTCHPGIWEVFRQRSSGNVCSKVLEGGLVSEGEFRKYAAMVSVPSQSG